MFAAPTISQTACKATCSSKGAGSPHPVFAQCNQPASTDGDSCEKHVRGQLKSACDWEPLTFFLGLPDKALTAAWKCACSRYKRHHVGVSSSASLGGASAATSDGVAPRLQREFVALTQAEKDDSQLRCFSDVATALPPHPSMLCNSAFGSAVDLRAHVTDKHHGMLHYRQRLAYLCEQFEAV